MLAQWLVDELPKGRVTTSVSAGRDIAPHRVHESSAIEVVANQVCERCNNGWMSALEGKVKPFLLSIVRGHRRTYYEQGQRLISAWAVKTGLTFELVNPDPQMRTAIRDVHYRASRAASPSPPSKMHVWLGHIVVKRRRGIGAKTF